jgi:AraC-like DNA-binding protein
MVKEVAAELNFADSAHLDHQFNTYHGGAPSQCVRIFHERRRKALERGILEEDIILPWKEAERRLASQLRRRRVPRIVDAMTAA